MDDALSSLLSLADPVGSVDLVCAVGGSFGIPHAPTSGFRAPFHLVSSGSCFVTVPGMPPLVLSAGDFVLLPTGSEHLLSGAAGSVPGAATPATRLRPVPAEPGSQRLVPNYRAADGQSEVEIICGHFRYSAGAGELFFGALPRLLRVPLPPAAQGSSEQISALLHREAGVGGAGSTAIISALCTALLALALRSTSVRIPTAWAVANDPDLLPAVHALLAAPADPPSLPGAAQLSGLSRAGFARRFRQASGQPWGEFSARVRMMIAAQELRSGTVSVEMIAKRVGYRSTAAFRQRFGQTLGRSPLRFRQEFSTGARD